MFLSYMCTKIQGLEVQGKNPAQIITYGTNCPMSFIMESFGQAAIAAC